MRLFIITVLLLLFAMPVQAAWPDKWTREPLGVVGTTPSITTVAGNGIAFLQLPDATLVTDDSPWITLQAFESVLCIDTDKDDKAEYGYNYKKLFQCLSFQSIVLSFLILSIPILMAAGGVSASGFASGSMITDSDWSFS